MATSSLRCVFTEIDFVFHKRARLKGFVWKRSRCSCSFQLLHSDHHLQSSLHSASHIIFTGERVQGGGDTQCAYVFIRYETHLENGHTNNIISSLSDMTTGPSTFAASGEEAISRPIDLSSCASAQRPACSDLLEFYEIEQTAKAIKAGDFKRVCPIFFVSFMECSVVPA